MKKKVSFADKAKYINKKYSKRDNDSLSDEQKERELTDLMNKQEEMRANIMNNAYKKAYGGIMNKYQVGGGMPQNNPKQQQMMEQIAQQLQQGATPQQVVNELIKSGMDRNQAIQLVQGIVQQIQQQSSQQNQRNPEEQVQQFKYGGNGDFFTQTTKDKNIQLDDAGLSDNQPSNYYNSYPSPISNPLYDTYKYPSLKPWNINSKNSLLNTNKSLENGVRTNYKTAEFDNSQVTTVPTKQAQPKSNNFDINSLGNIGSYLGSAYDIYRGMKGGAKVNYDRVNPELVNYSQSRDLMRNDILTGYRDVKNTLKDASGGNSALYLSQINSLSGKRDKDISDNIIKYGEAEKNANAEIKNKAKYFNSDVQMKEADARQMEKDEASNTLRNGLYSFGKQSSQDYADNKNDSAFINSIQSKYPDWQYDKRTGLWKHRQSGDLKTTESLISK